MRRRVPARPTKRIALNRPPNVSRPLMLLFALAFLFETWVWDRLVALARWIAAKIPWERMRRAAKRVINRLPAIVAVLLFGVPVIVMELGSFFSVVAIAFGHVILGAIGYAVLKLCGVSLIAVIYDLTREKLMSLAWFVWLHGKFEWLHAYAHELLAPYRQAAVAFLKKARAQALLFWRRWRARSTPQSDPAAEKPGALASDAEFD
jgi:hypothetical protein